MLCSLFLVDKTTLICQSSSLVCSSTFISMAVSLNLSESKSTGPNLKIVAMRHILPPIHVNLSNVRSSFNVHLT